MIGLEIRTCLRGQLNFTGPGPLRPVIGCDCSQCCETSRHFMAATSAVWNTVEIKGEVVWYHFSGQAWHGFFGRQLFWDGWCENIAFFASSFNGDTGTALAGHIFCADKGDYYQTNDGLPQAVADDLDLSTQFYKLAVVQ